MTDSDSESDSDTDYTTRSQIPKDQRQPLSRKAKSNKAKMPNEDANEIEKYKKRAAEFETNYNRQLAENEKFSNKIKTILSENSELKELNNKLSDKTIELRKRLEADKKKPEIDLELKKIEDEEKELQDLFKSKFAALRERRIEMHKVSGVIPHGFPETELNEMFQNLTSGGDQHSTTALNEFIIHPSSTQIAKIVGILGDDSSQFPKWIQSLKSFLEIHQVWINPDKKFDELNDLERSKSRAARRLLNLCVDGNSNTEIKKFENSIDAINALKSLHDANTATNRIEAQHRVSTTIYREGECMATHISKLRKAFDDLSRFDSPTTQTWQVDQLINSLPPGMNGLKNMFASWPSDMYTFDRVATNLREAYSREKLSQVMMNSTKQNDTSYATDSRYNHLRQQSSGDDRSRSMNYKNAEGNSRSRELSTSNHRNNRFSSDSKNRSYDSKTYRSPHRSISRDRSEEEVFERNSDDEGKSQAAQATSSSTNEYNLSTIAYEHHGGYFAKIMNSAVPSIKSGIREQFQKKRRAKRFLRRSEANYAKDLIAEKKLISVISRPAKNEYLEVSPSERQREEFPTYSSWSNRKRVRFDTINEHFSFLKDNPKLNQNDRCDKGSSKRKKNFPETLKSTVVTVPVDKNNKNLGFRQVYNFSPLSAQHSSVKSRLGPPTSTATIDSSQTPSLEMHANITMFKDVLAQIQSTGFSSKKSTLQVMQVNEPLDDDVVNIDEDVVIEEIDNILNNSDEPMRIQMRALELSSPTNHSIIRADGNQPCRLVD